MKALFVLLPWAVSGVAAADPDPVDVQWSQTCSIRDGIVAVPADVPAHADYDPDRDYITASQLACYETVPPIIDLGGSPLSASLAASFGSAAGISRLPGFTGMRAPISQDALAAGITDVIGLDHGVPLGSPTVGDVLAGPLTRPILDRTGWEQNGTEIASCNEYVYERWYDYSQFEDSLTGTNYRAMFDAGVPRLINGVHSKSGRGVPAQLVAAAPTTEPQPKNHFFTFPVDRYPPGTEALHHQFADPELADRIRNGQAVWRHSVGWHQWISQQLANVPDDKLYALADKQRDFDKLLAQREAIYQHWVAFAMQIDAGQRKCTQVAPWSVTDRIAQIWDPPDYISAGFMHGIYEGARHWVSEAPAELGAPAGAGVMPSATLSFQTRVGGVSQRLTLDPADPLALGELAYLESYQPPTEIAPADIPDDLGDVDPACQGLFGADGLPLLIPTQPPSCANAQGMQLCADQVAAKVARKLDAMDARIEAALEQVRPYGCLDLGASVRTGEIIPSACDWTPEMFVREMTGHFTKQREVDHTACEAAIGTAWGPTDQIHDPQTAKWGLPPVAPGGKPTYSHSAGDVHTFIALVKAWAATIVDFERDPTGKAVIGHSRSGHDSIGNSDFGLSYGYDARWGLTNTQQSDPCQVGIEAVATAHANARAFKVDLGEVLGHGKYLFETGAHLTNDATEDGRTGGATAKLELLGNDIYDDAVPGVQADDMFGHGLQFNIAPHWEHTETLVTAIVQAGPVPLTIRAGVAGSIGLELDGGVSWASACPTITTQLYGQVTPHVHLEAVASASTGIEGVAEAGVQVNLTLIDLRIPLTMAMAIGPSYETATPVEMIDASPSLRLTLATLSGAVKVFVRFLDMGYSENLFSWRGLDLYDTELFLRRWHYPLGAVLTAWHVENPS